MNEQARGGLPDAATGYWVERLKGATSLLELPFDRPRPTSGPVRREHVPVSLPAAVGTRLRQLAAERNVAPSLLLAVAWAALLARLSTQPELVLGYADGEGRERLPLRFDFAADPELDALLAQDRSAAAESLRVQTQNLVAAVQVFKLSELENLALYRATSLAADHGTEIALRTRAA